MTDSEGNESLPRPAEDVEAPTDHYDADDTSSDVEHGTNGVRFAGNGEPAPMNERRVPGMCGFRRRTTGKLNP